MTEKTKKELEFLEAYVLYKTSSEKLAEAGKAFTRVMKEAKPILEKAERRDEIDNFSAEVAESAALALGKMGRAYHAMGEALGAQSENLSRCADEAHTLIDEAKEAANG